MDENVINSATEKLNTFTPEERLAIAHVCMKELSQLIQDENPSFAESVSESDEINRKVLCEMVRELADEKQVGELAVMCAWFVLRADRKTLLAFNLWMDKDEKKETSLSKLFSDFEESERGKHECLGN